MSCLVQGKGDSKTINEEGKQYSGNECMDDRGGVHADKTETREQGTSVDYLGDQIRETVENDLSNRIHELRMGEPRVPDKVDIFE